MIQKPATSSFASVNGPSMTARLSPLAARGLCHASNEPGQNRPRGQGFECNSPELRRVDSDSRFVFQLRFPPMTSSIRLTKRVTIAAPVAGGTAHAQIAAPQDRAVFATRVDSLVKAYMAASHARRRDRGILLPRRHAQHRGVLEL